jgi:hypothetical protein
MKRTITFIGVFAGLFIMFATVHTADANHTWGTYHWARTSNPFTLKLGDNLTAAWDPYLAQTSFDWSSSTVLNTTIVPGNTNNIKGKNTPKNCTPTSGRGEVCNAKYGAIGWLGIASIWASGDHITAGTVKLNDTYFATANYNKPAWKNLVMCQEVGHLFGLGHQDETFNNANLDTCMDYTNSPDSNQHPNAHDYALLEQIYSHLDTTTTLANSVSLLAADSNNPSDWGAEIHRSENGRSSIFVKDLGNGNRVVRHVYWVEPRGNHHHD